MRYSERNECIKSLIRLKQQEEVIEKALDNYLDSAKLEPEILRDLRNEKVSCTLDRKKWTSSLRITVEDITNDLQVIKSVIGNLREGRKIDTDSFKEKLIALADKIREYKKNTILETLTNEEIELDRDLHNFFLISHKYEKRNSSSGLLIASRETSKIKNSGSTDFHDYSGLRDFDALIAKTGHTENWSEEDHLFFLKIRKATRGIPAMVEAIKKKFPDMTTEKIVNHEAWYKIYLELREKQRRTVKEWRERKEMEKKSKIDRAESEIKSAKTNETICDRDTVTKVEYSENPSKIIARYVIKKNPIVSDKKESLNRWRIEKENARSFEQEKIKLANEQREARKESRRLARADQLKSALESYREKKSQSRTSSSAASIDDSERVNSKAKAAEMIKGFRRQDEEFLSRRKALLLSKKRNSSAPGHQRINLQSEKKSTLLKPTKGWLEKCKVEEIREGEPRQFLFVKDIPKLGTYNWRNQEST